MTPWAVVHQASLSSTISQSLLKFMSTESVMLCNHPSTVWENHTINYIIAPLLCFLRILVRPLYSLSNHAFEERLIIKEFGGLGTSSCFMLMWYTAYDSRQPTTNVIEIHSRYVYYRYTGLDPVLPKQLDIKNKVKCGIREQLQIFIWVISRFP